MSNIFSFLSNQESCSEPEISETDILKNQLSILKDRFQFLNQFSKSIFWEIDISVKILHIALNFEDLSLEVNNFKSLFQELKINNFQDYQIVQNLKRELIDESNFENFYVEISNEINIIQVNGKRIFSGDKLVRIIGVNEKVKINKVIPKSEKPIEKKIEEVELKIEKPKITVSINTKIKESLTNSVSLEIKRVKRNNQNIALIFFSVERCFESEELISKDITQEVLTDIEFEIDTLKRDTDIFGLWEEKIFIIILPDTDILGADTFAKRLRRKVKLISFKKKFELTINFSITPFHEENDADKFIENGYKTLLESQRNGDNKIVIYKE